MKTETHTASRRRSAPAVFRPTLSLFCRGIFLLPVVSLTLAIAQTAPTTPPAPTGGTPAQAPGLPEENEWRYAARLTTVLAYDDNIFIRPSNERSDFLLHAAPSFAIGIGNFRSEFAPFAAIPHFIARTGEEELPHKTFAFASYTPDMVLFAKHHGLDEVNHDVRFEGRREEERWTAHGLVHVESVAEPDIDVGRRIRQTYYTGEAGVAAELSGRTTGSVTLRSEHSDYSGGLASTDTQLGGFVDYQVAPKSKIGLGAAGGYLAVANGANQTYVQPLVRVKYEPTGKLSLNAQAGEEFRHFDSSVGRRSQFVFALSGDYAAAEGTKFSLSGRRETRSSAEYSGEDIVATTYQGAVRQRFLSRTYLGLAGGFVRNDYETNQVTPTVARRDNYYFGKISSSRDLTERGTVELAYEYRSNDSSVGNFGFNENVISLTASFLF